MSAAAETVGSPSEFRQILGIRFFVGDARRAIDLLRNGGLLVVPAAPALKNVSVDIAYREALLGADVVITDSSLMVMVWNFLQSDNIRRLSGLEYLAELLTSSDFRDLSRPFWIMANPASASTNVKWLREQGIEVQPDDIYVAPTYGAVIEDETLLELFRCISDPKRYVPRYWAARKLITLMLRYRGRDPIASAN
jgi:N-acetylglucosaminyldiphosphoundecaprenol N-acetyl-beta-D-mannosaminyltransferase